MKTTESFNSEARDAVRRAPEDIQTSSPAATEEVKWIQVPVGDERIIWPAHFVSEFNDITAAY